MPGRVDKSIRDADMHRSDADTHKTERHARVPDSVLHDGKLSLAARAVYAEMARHAFSRGVVYAGQRLMADQLRVDQGTVSRHIGELIRLKHVELTRETLAGKRARYRLLSPVFQPRG